MKEQEKKTQVVVVVGEVAMGHYDDAIISMSKAVHELRNVDGCPEAIIKRAETMVNTTAKSRDNFAKRLSTLGSKAEREAAKAKRAEAVVAKKVAKIARIKARIEKDNANLAKLEAK